MLVRKRNAYYEFRLKPQQPWYYTRLGWIELLIFTTVFAGLVLLYWGL